MDILLELLKLVGILAGGMVVAMLGLAVLIRVLPEPTANQHISCPHCHTTGQVYVSDVSRKKGISGGKATGALLTGGASLLATGLSRKEGAKHLRCGRCGMEWDA